MREGALITNTQKFSVRDGPGIRSVVFFKGCPLRCQWCANPENINPEQEMMFYDTKCIGCGYCVKACPNHALTLEKGTFVYDREKCRLCGMCTGVCGAKARVLKGNKMTVSEVIEDLDSDEAFYRSSGGGVTFSGGEPLLHPEFIKEIAADYRAKGFNSAVETCGCVPWENIEKVKDWLDLFLYDVKFVDEEKHIAYCGGSNRRILDNLKKLCETGNVNVIVRTPIIPQINDTERDLKLLTEFLGTIQDKLEGIHILPYHNFGISKYDSLGKEYKLSHIKTPDREHMEKIKDMLEQQGLNVLIGG